MIFSQHPLLCFSRDLVLFKCGSWSKKIEVAKALKGEEISVNLISSEYGKAVNHEIHLYYTGILYHTLSAICC